MSISRRGFLKHTFAFSAAAALAGGRRFSLAADAISAPAAGEQVHHYLAVGDYGVITKDLPRQQAVATSMIKYAADARLKPDALFLLGDNFYGGMAGKGIKSPRWQINVEGMYPADAFPGPLHAMLGNHDYTNEPGKKSVQAQLDYRKANPTSRWSLPSKWYRMTLPAEKPLATVLVLDTNFCYGNEKIVGKAERAEQLQWLSDELARPRTTPWLFVCGHHPVFNMGHHGDTADLVQAVDPLFKKHKVDLYLCGHDHDLQHIEAKEHPTSFVISGAGGAKVDVVNNGKYGPFIKNVYGYSHLELRADTFTMRHIDVTGVQLHAFTKTTAGQVTVL